MPDRDSPLVNWQTENNVGEPHAETPGLEPMTFGFGTALGHLRNGRRVRRSVWSPDVHLALQRPDAHSKMTHPYIFVTSRFGLVPWCSTQVELLSEDWTLA